MKPLNDFITIGVFALLLTFIGGGFLLIRDFSPSPLASFVSLNKTEKVAEKGDSIKAIYLTSLSASNEKKVKETINFIKDTELNAVVIDIKDYEGSIMYNADHPKARSYNAIYDVIPNIENLIEQFHSEGIYTIARMPIFQDTELAEARTDLAVKSKARGGAIWRDYNGLAWVDPANHDTWDYNITLMRDATKRGFDEINLDYIRFPSDGVLSDMTFPRWDGKTPKNIIIRNFMRYVRRQLPDTVISADLFGFATSRTSDLGIGQIIEDAFESFDYVSPMIYPSHYPAGHLGFQNPAEHPYAVVRQATRNALWRLYAYQDPLNGSKLRPWLQDFNLGAVYDAQMVRAQIDGLYGAFNNTPYDPVINGVNGFMLWNSSNNYTRDALEPATKEY